MLGNLKGLLVTLKTMLRKPVTVQYPDEHLPLDRRYKGFPGLTWDEDVGEPYCTACMVCIRYCPTQCMYATGKDNPLHKEGKSHRKRLVETFAIDVAHCIVCGICVEVCNFDAIVMTDVHEQGAYDRRSLVTPLPVLLEWGKEAQRSGKWEAPPRKETQAAAPDKAAERATS